MVNLGINEIKELTKSMRDYPNMDYTDYSFSFLKRRLAMIFSILNIKRKEQFLSLLGNEDSRHKIISNMLVNSTEMFRDPAVWRFLRDKVISNLPEKSVIWLPSESSGEEAFSISVILYEKFVYSNFSIVCSNPSIHKCNLINQGLLNGVNFDLNHTNYKRLEENDSYNQYFTRKNNYIIVNDKLKFNIQCNHGNIQNTIPSGNISLIIFRNSAIYLNHRLSEKIFTFLYENLIPGGFLVIGVKEQLPVSVAQKMIVVDESEKVFRKPHLPNNGI